MSAATDWIPQERLPAKRRAPSPHPVVGEALRARVLGERGRISRLSRIRELVLGFQDGLPVPLAVVTGLAGAHRGRRRRARDGHGRVPRDRGRRRC